MLSKYTRWIAWIYKDPNDSFRCVVYVVEFFSVLDSDIPHKNKSFLSLANTHKKKLYLHFSNWFFTVNRIPFAVHKSFIGKSVNTIQIWFDLTRSEKDFSQREYFGRMFHLAASLEKLTIETGVSRHNGGASEGPLKPLNTIDPLCVWCRGGFQVA